MAPLGMALAPRDSVPNTQSRMLAVVLLGAISLLLSSYTRAEAPADEAPQATTGTPGEAPSAPEPAISEPSPAAGESSPLPATYAPATEPPPSPEGAELGYEGPYEVQEVDRSRSRARGTPEHDGLFVRVTLGFGAAHTSYQDENRDDVDNRGLAVLASVSVGGRVYRSLIAHGDLLLTGVSDARREVEGVRDPRNRISLSLAMATAGLTYYAMPNNVLFGGGLGIGVMREQRDEEPGPESGLGVGGYLTVGKEWWVGRRQAWGVGAALRAAFLRAPVDVVGVESVMRGSDVGVLFSATYN